MLGRSFDANRASVLTRLIIDAVETLGIDLSRRHIFELTGSSGLGWSMALAMAGISAATAAVRYGRTHMGSAEDHAT